MGYLQFVILELFSAFPRICKLNVLGDKCSRRGLQIRISMEATSRYDRNALNVMLNVAKFEMDYIKVWNKKYKSHDFYEMRIVLPSPLTTHVFSAF